MSFRVLFLFLLTCQFYGCSSIKEFVKESSEKVIALSECSFELVDVDKYVSFTQNTSNFWNYVIEYTIAAKNPTKMNISIGEYELDVYANGQHLSLVTASRPISLKPLGITYIKAKSIISPNGAVGLFLDKLSGYSIEYKIDGTFYLKHEYITMPITVELLKFIEY